MVCIDLQSIVQVWYRDLDNFWSNFEFEIAIDLAASHGKFNIYLYQQNSSKKKQNRTQNSIETIVTDIYQWTKPIELFTK